jgi:phthalate 4,5-dioxygenase oxygenase subunit
MTPQQNELMCRVEGDAAMGRVMRGYWLPVCMSSEVAEPDGAPRRARLLGVDLVVFRDSAGRPGVLDEACPHRGASLVYGRNEECGLRCLYHGWKFGVDGEAIEMPSEPPATRLTAKLRARAYPVEESGGFVWAWLGDADKPAPFTPPVWAQVPNERIAIVKIHAACNWAQVLEGSIDSAHSSSLHAANMPSADQVAGSTATDTQWLRPSADRAPRLQLERTPYGFRYAAIRTPLRDPERQDYVRTTLWIAPFTVMIPPTDRYNLIQMLVPIDDVNCMFYWIAWHPTRGITTAEWQQFCHAVPGVDVDPLTFAKTRNRGNDYLQDRAAMAAGDMTGILGVPAQDMAMWESMGPIADRSADRLGSSDRAIVEFRKVALRMAGDAAAGRDHGFIPYDFDRDGVSFEGLVDRAHAPQQGTVDA